MLTLFNIRLGQFDMQNYLRINNIDTFFAALYPYIPSCADPLFPNDFSQLEEPAARDEHTIHCNVLGER